MGRVLGQRVLDERRLRPPGRQQHLDLVDARLDQLLPERVGQLARRASATHLARLGIGHVERQHVVLPVAGGGRLLLFPHVERGVAGEDGDRS